MGLTAIVDLLRTLTAIVDWESWSALTPVPLGARLADLDSHESQASLLSHSLLGDQIQKVNCATECEDMPITSSTSSSKLCGLDQRDNRNVFEPWTLSSASGPPRRVLGHVRDEGVVQDIGPAHVRPQRPKSAACRARRPTSAD